TASAPVTPVSSQSTTVPAAGSSTGQVSAAVTISEESPTPAADPVVVDAAEPESSEDEQPASNRAPAATGARNIMVFFTVADGNRNRRPVRYRPRTRISRSGRRSA